MRFLRWVVIGLGAIGVIIVGGLGLAAWLVDIGGLIATYKPQAVAAASEALDRPVELGDVSPTWFPTLGLRAEAITIGDQPLSSPPTSGAPAEADRFVELDAIEVGIAVWPALLSLGQDIEVTKVRLEGPKIRVVRFADGTFNFSTLGPQDEAPPEPPPEEDGGFADRLTSAKVGEVAITNGVVIYEDRAPDGTGTLEIHQLGFQAADVGLGLPVAAKLTAALGVADEAEPNLELRITTGALASAVADLGAPEVQEVALVAKSLPLAEVPANADGVQLDNARLSADIRVRSTGGDAVAISGPLAVRGLRLAPKAGEAPAQAPLDIALELAVATSTAFGTFALDGTKLTVGPLGLALAGSVETDPALQWRGIKVQTIAGVAPAALLRLLPGEPAAVPQAKLTFNLRSTGNLNRAHNDIKLALKSVNYAQDGLSAQGDVHLSASTQGSLSQPKVSAALDLAQLAIQGDGFAKPKGVAAGLTATTQVGLTSAEVSALELTLGKATITGSAHYPLGAAGDLRATLMLTPLALRPFLSELQMESAQVPKGSQLSCEVHYRAAAATPGNGAIRIPNLRFEAGKNVLNTSIQVDSLTPLVTRVQGRAGYLNLDELLPADEANGTVAPATPGEPAPPPPANEEPVLDESGQAMRVAVDFEVKSMIYSGIDMQNLNVKLELRNGKLHVRSTRIGMLGGSVAADGTTLDLTKAPIAYHIVTKLDGLQGNNLLNTVAEVGDSITGKLNSELNLKGQGFEPEQLNRTLNGSFSFALLKGHLDGVNLTSSVLTPLHKALTFLKKRARFNVDSRLQTGFGRLAGHFRVADGKLNLSKPLHMATSQGEITFTGGMHLDGTLAFKGSYAVPPKLIGQLTAGQVRPKQDLPVAFRLGCDLTKPCVERVDVDPAAKALATMYAGKAVDLAVDAVAGKTGLDLSEAKEALKDTEAAKQQAEEEARRRAEQAKAEAEAKAKAAAEAAKAKAAKEAKKKLRGLFGR